MVFAICLLVSGFIAKLMGMSGLRASLGERGGVGYSPSASCTGDKNGDE